MELVVALILVGAALLAAETILPGLVAGSLGIICLIWGVVLAYIRLGFNGGSVVLGVVVVGLLVGTILWVKYLPESRIGKLFISRQTAGDSGVEHLDLIGQEGTAVSDLRPSGVATINGRRMGVVTEGAMVARGTPVKVIGVEGIRVVVRPLA